MTTNKPHTISLMVPMSPSPFMYQEECNSFMLKELILRNLLLMVYLCFEKVASVNITGREDAETDVWLWSWLVSASHKIASKSLAHPRFVLA
jgi:hypothetical protein